MDSHSRPVTPPNTHPTKKVTADFSSHAPSAHHNNNNFLPGIGGGLNKSSSDTAVQPALGLSWANCVHTRFLLTRRDGPGGAGAVVCMRVCRVGLGGWMDGVRMCICGAVGSCRGHLQPTNPTYPHPPNPSTSNTGSHFIRQMRLLLSPSHPSDSAVRFVVQPDGVRGQAAAGAGAQGGAAEEQAYERQQQQQSH